MEWSVRVGRGELESGVECESWEGRVGKVQVQGSRDSLQVTALDIYKHRAYGIQGHVRTHLYTTRTLYTTLPEDKQ